MTTLGKKTFIIRRLISGETIIMGEADSVASLIASAVKSNISLAVADLSNADLTAAHLEKADLTRANLQHADLMEADLTQADLRGADLTGANLERADLTAADLLGANLTGANLAGARLSKANLARADFTGANLLYADLSYCNLVGGNLTGADMTGTNMEGAHMFKVTKNKVAEEQARSRALRQRFVWTPTRFVLFQIFLLFLQSIAVPWGPIVMVCMWAACIMINVYPLFFSSYMWLIGVLVQTAYMPIVLFGLRAAGNL